MLPTSDPADASGHRLPPVLPSGSRAEQLLLVAQLIADLASTPFHLLVFLFTRRRHRRDFALALGAARTELQATQAAPALAASASDQDTSGAAPTSEVSS